MRCNIDAKGKAMRLIAGIVGASIGAAVLVMWRVIDDAPGWLCVPAGAMLFGGAFMIFEGWAGWCVVRALGIRTRI